MLMGIVVLAVDGRQERQTMKAMAKVGRRIIAPTQGSKIPSDAIRLFAVDTAQMQPLGYIEIHNHGLKHIKSFKVRKLIVRSDVPPDVAEVTAAVLMKRVTLEMEENAKGGYLTVDTVKDNHDAIALLQNLKWQPLGGATAEGKTRFVWFAPIGKAHGKKTRTAG